ncbi:hypothetical protein FRM10_02395 [Campylobacter coli]|nr:hypothetical protein BLD33_09810 [Campylobacter coli]KQH93284.1 hypothetical protein K779_02920 [Campylobacter coli CVM 41986]KQI13751.1 hypothetical protein Y856_04370 [Campylobacter coli CVM 41939]KQI17973.1 hypothetical protein Y857_03655 [Campylobacter coli CVM 41955]KQI34136.1 hypothetical protein Y859_08800 [Campylobacter coli CVM 41958]
MFLDFIGKAFIFITIYLMTIFIVKSHFAVIKTSLKYFDFRFIFIYNIAFLVAEYFMFLAYSKYILN